MAETTRSWMETMNYVAGDPGRPAVLIVLAQNGGASLDEMNLAARSGMLQQQLTGAAVETAVMVKHIIDLSDAGFLERDEGGFKWQMTPLGVLVSRQWVPGEIEPQTDEALSNAEITTWRDDIIAFMDHDVELARDAGIAEDEWLMTESRRLYELVVLNKVLGEQKMPEWLEKMRASGIDPTGNLET